MGYKTELRNGSSVDSQRIKTFYDSWLKPLYNQDANLVMHLYFLAQNEEYQIPESLQPWYEEAGFLDGGKLDSDFRNVILSALTVDYEESKMSIERPEKPRVAAPQPAPVEPAEE